MGLFKKRGPEEYEKSISATRKELDIPKLGEDPDLPKLPEMPKLPKLKELPTLPSRQEIKQEIEKPSEVPGIPAMRASPDMQPSIMAQQAAPIEPSTKTPTGPITTAPPETKPISKEPIFVKIDKFKDAVQSFELVKDRVEDIEKMLNEIKAIKMKEDQEIKQWENEINVIKSRVENIDESLFKELER